MESCRIHILGWWICLFPDSLVTVASNWHAIEAYILYYSNGKYEVILREICCMHVPLILSCFASPDSNLKLWITILVHKYTFKPHKTTSFFFLLQTVAKRWNGSKYVKWKRHWTRDVRFWVRSNRRQSVGRWDAAGPPSRRHSFCRCSGWRTRCWDWVPSRQRRATPPLTAVVGRVVGRVVVDLLAQTPCARENTIHVHPNHIILPRGHYSWHW